MVVIKFEKNPSKRSDLMKFWIFQKSAISPKFHEIQILNQIVLRNCK